MLTFLRKIRRALIDSGSVSKYILYAIGEIALVVIGILIALQINNWNEWEKNRVIERKLLVGIVENIQTNCEILEENIHKLESSNNSRRIIMEVIKNRLPNNDTLNFHFENSNVRPIFGFFLTEEGFQALSNKGFDIIESDTLRTQIVRLFQTTYGKNKSIFNDTKQLIFSWITPLDQAKKRFSDSIDEVGVVPMDYKSLLKDIDYYNQLKLYIDQDNWLKSISLASLTESKRVLRLIKDELEKE